ncbi:E3 SUMO-protein ligase ZBED1 isoform X1 [Drosophila santomea]|uniref:E3 SUMO-protein ligase ZBED1 isoform X1 n=2 Tax=Drosophila santomea TaxID=129105 RepID=UPI001952BEEB|nr:E3 SUMO-protein ligase ZBED1 isoform X1 [Drosophila santomea]
MPTMSRSKIWKFYDKLDRNSAQCQLCEKVIKTCGNTSNLMKHMKTHPQIDLFDDDTVVERGIYKRREQDDKLRFRKVLPIKEESSDFHCELLLKAAKDAGSIIEQDDQGMTKAAAEDHISMQSVGYAWVPPETTDSRTETVGGEDIIEFEPKEELEEPEKNPLHQIQAVPFAGLDNLKMDGPLSSRSSFHQDVAFFVCRDRQPLQIVQGEGFKHLLKVLCPIYEPPSAAELEAIINRESEMRRSKLRQQLAAIPTLSLSCSVHTKAESQSWMELVAHFHEGRQRISRTLSVMRVPDLFTSNEIVEHMEQVCQRFDIPKSKICCVTTRSSQLLEDAVTTFLGASHHVPCFADHLNSLLEAVVQRPEIRDLRDRVRPYVQSTVEMDGHSLQINPQLNSIHRPISTYDMLDLYLKHTLVQDPLLLSRAEVDLCQQLLDVLRPLTSSMRELTRAPYPAASTALPIAQTLINELKQEKSAEHKVARELRLFIVQQLEENFESMERNLHLAMASLLDPRFRNIPFQSGALVAQYMTQLYDMMQAHLDSGESAAVKDPEDRDHYDIWAAFKSFSHEKQRLVNGSSGADADDEISRYFCAGMSTLRADPFELWEELAKAHPFLHSEAQRYLHIPATAEPADRLFTADGAAVTAQYAALIENNMENVLFMADVPTKEWQL